ncbi:MAG TPA: hypothetical protein VM555_00380 [Tahibacter sp.]|jgi:hypothetical protein|nr:hypothetical protein [Tahibacter sp.]
MLEFFSPVAALIAPLLWFTSPTFRARTRLRWDQRGNRERIGDVLAWGTAWLFVALITGLIMTFGT